MKYVCTVCGWEYDESVGYPEGGIAPGTPWSEVPVSNADSSNSVIGLSRFSKKSINISI